MYAPVSASGRMAAAKNAWPLAAICCLGILGFLIVAVIILALIPIYLPSSASTITNNTGTFYIQYSATPNSLSDSLTGTVTNPATVGTSAGLDSTSASISSGQSQATTSRRRRSALDHRQKRALQTNFLFLCTPIFTSGCITQLCRNNTVTALQQKIKQKTSFSVSITISSSGVLHTATYTLTFVGISTTKPTGFAGEATSFNFTASQTGLYTNTTTWIGGIVPYGNATVVIPSGITVTIAGSSLDVLVALFDVSGTLAFGQGASTFTFSYPTTIIIRSGGTLKDLTTSRSLTITSDTIITALTGGTNLGSDTSVIIGSTGNKRSIGDVLRFSSAPFTCGILNGGGFTFPRVNPICRRNGGILSPFSYLGGFVPSVAVCGDGCGIYIPTGITLSTSEVSGVMTIKISYLGVATGAALSLGSSGVSGFVFASPVQMEVYGTLSFVGSGGSLQVPAGSACNMYFGSFFTSVTVQSISIQTIDTSGNSLGTPLPLVAGQAGPFYINIPSTGIITSNTITPAGNSTVSGVTMPMGGVTMPTGGITMPTGGVTMPTGGVTMPTGGVTMPTGGVTMPTGGVTMPTGGVTMPTGGVTMPTGGVTMPTGGVTMPTGGVTMPTGGVTMPTGGVTMPTGGVTMPTGGVTMPTGGVTMPTGGVTMPTGGVTMPTGGVTMPTGGVTMPTGGVTTPSSG